MKKKLKVIVSIDRTPMTEEEKKIRSCAILYTSAQMEI